MTERTYGRAGLIGGSLAGVIFLGVLLGGHLSLLQQPPGDPPAAGDFYDVQAHSLLGLHWDVPRKSLFVEGFLIHGKVYEYFGPFPALLRLPIAAVTHGLDGRLGQISLLLAFAVAMTFTVRLAWRLRPLVRKAAPVTRGEQWAVGALAFLVGAGSVLVFLASRSWAYHEAELWGLALAIAAFEFVVALILEPSRRYVVLASAFTTAAMLSRVSVGLGPLGALGLVLLATFWPGARRLAGIADGITAKSLRLPLAAAIVVPLALYTYVNYSKFGTLFSVPFNNQFSRDLFPLNRKILAANGGSMFNPKLLPTDALQYLRPDAIRITSLFPWVTFSGHIRLIGNAVIDATWSASYPSAMPALTALGLVGLYGVVRPSKTDEPSLAALRIPVIAGAIALIPTLAFASLANRYLSDFIPVGVLLSLAGFHMLMRWASARAPSSLPRLAFGGLGVLAVLSVWFNVGLGVVYGRAFAAADSDLASFVAFQYRLHDRFPGGSPPRVLTGSRLPPASRHQEDAFVLGDCEGLFWSDGADWRLLERSDSGGRFRMRVRFPTAPTDWEPLVVSGRGRDAQSIGVRVLAGNKVQFAYNVIFAGPKISIPPGRSHVLELAMDPTRRSPIEGAVYAILDGHVAYSTVLPNSIIDQPVRPLSHVTVGRTDTPGRGLRFTGTLERLPPKISLCRKLQAEVHQ